MPVSEHYRPRPVFSDLGRGFFSVVSPAGFPRHVIRYRNQGWAERLGLGELDEEEWIDHFGRFRALPDNLAEPLALPYHGHQFRAYNPDLGDGRGFLFAQMEDPVDGRLLDLSSKGSGETPYSRDLDGRLTLKGAVREALAGAMLEALGVYTSKTLSIIETGERLYRPGEQGPQRSAVLVRVSHGHLRIGSFERLATYRDPARLGRLLDFALRSYLPEVGPGAIGSRATAFLHAVAQRLAEMAASWMVAGFAHGVLNTDNMNVTGESFDFGPYRFLEAYDPGLVPADFDEIGLYAFGRQPAEVMWSLKQLGYALAPICGGDDLIPPIESFAPAFTRALHRRFMERLGVGSRGAAADAALVEAAYEWLIKSGAAYDRFFFDLYGGAAPRQHRSEGSIAETTQHPALHALSRRLSEHGALDPRRLEHPYLQRCDLCTLHHAEIEAIWTAIAEEDDWRPFEAKLSEIDEMKAALTLPVSAPGHRPLWPGAQDRNPN